MDGSPVSLWVSSISFSHCPLCVPSFVLSAHVHRVSDRDVRSGACLGPLTQPLHSVSPPEALHPRQDLQEQSPITLACHYFHSWPLPFLLLLPGSSGINELAPHSDV